MAGFGLRLRPERSAWLRILASPSSYCLAVAALFSLAAKLVAAWELELAWPLLIGAWASLADVALYLGLAAGFAWTEGRSRWWSVVTYPVAALLLMAAGANAAYLVISGEQGGWDALVDLWERRSDARLVLEEQLGESDVRIGLGLGLLALVSLPLGLRWTLARFSRAWSNPGDARARSLACATLAVVFGFLALAAPAPSRLEANVLGRNVLAVIARGALREPLVGSFKGWAPAAVTPSELAALRQRPRHNVLVVVLESTRFDFTSLAGKQARARTARLEQLAERGWSAPFARAVLPHTTKSLFSMLCGRFPTLQKGLIEVSQDTKVQCLPEILRDSGYQTAFFQSAVGSFEQRPRLIEKFGFEQFQAHEDIGGRKVGYVGSDDGSLVQPVDAWVKTAKEPFMLTVLTSAAHHPYRLPRRLAVRARKDDLPQTTAQERYARLIEAEDEVLGALVDILEGARVLERTLVVVVGDHGEGFGDHGVRQHDNNFYEEGLRVPFVVAGPGIPAGRRFEGNASLVDVTPIVLGALGVRSSAGKLDGFDLLSAPPAPDLPRYFSCFGNMSCRGFVSGRHKVVVRPAAAQAWQFDLDRDPDEKVMRVLERSLSQKLPLLDRVIDGHRAENWPLVLDELTRFAPWWCPARSSACKHPKSTNPKYRYDPEERE